MSWAKLVEALEHVANLLHAIVHGEYCCLRHGLPYIRVGDLVEQVYCEMRLHYKLAEGVDVEARKRELRRLVEFLLEARRRVPARPTRRLSLSIPLAALVEGVPVVGRPDTLIIEDGKVRSLVWVKETSRVLRVYERDRIRLYSLGLLVDYSGLPRHQDMRLILVTVESREKLARALEELSSPRVGEGYAIHVLAYEREVALSHVAPLLAYWLQLREPTPRPSPWKCSSCPYRSVCQYASKAL